MNSVSQLSVLLIGGGNIAGGFDQSRARDAWPLTHAGALLRDGRFRMDTCIEPNPSRREAFAAHWPVAHMLSDIHELSPEARFDVVCICSPTRFHKAHLEFALQIKPKLVFCEKPLTPTLQDSVAMVERFDRADISMAVNHTRRWAPDILQLVAELRAGNWGSIRSVSGVYNKGTLNNGSHMIDLLSLLLGELHIAWVGTPEYDHWSDDPSIPFVLRNARGVVASVGIGHAHDFAAFELQLITERGVIAMERGGACWRIRRSEASQQFSGYQILSDAHQSDGRYEQAMTQAIGNLWRHLTANEPLACTGHDALRAQRLCETIRQQATLSRPVDELYGEPA